MVLLLVVGFCVGSIVVAGAEMSNANHSTATTTSTELATQTVDQTLTSTQVQISTLTSTSTTTSTTTSTILSTLTSTSTFYSSTYLTVTSVSSSTLTSTVTQTTTSSTTLTSTTTRTVTVTSTESTTGAEPVLLTSVSGSNSSNSPDFQLQSGNLTIEIGFQQFSPYPPASVTWTIAEASNLQTVDTGTFTGAGQYAATVSSLTPGTSYTLEIFSTDAVYTADLYQVG
jgi:hypothetical protein